MQVDGGSRLAKDTQYHPSPDKSPNKLWREPKFRARPDAGSPSESEFGEDISDPLITCMVIIFSGHNNARTIVIPMWEHMTWKEQSRNDEYVSECEMSKERQRRNRTIALLTISPPL